MVKNGRGKNYMSGKYFLDSNILVYCFDTNSPNKQDVAQKIVKKLVDSKNGQLSTQSLQEFFNVITRKLNCTKENAKQSVEYFSAAFPVHCNTVKDILTAISISIKTQFSFYDSLIVAAAKAENCDIVYSEDLNNGQEIDGIKIVNPFL